MPTPVFLKVIRASAVYDLIVTALFALPFTVRFLFDIINGVHERFGLAGAAPQTDDVYTVMFANLMGSVVVAWAIFRIVRPSVAAGAADTLARVLFSVGMISALSHGASPIVGVMLTLELAWGLTQGAVVIAALRARPHERMRTRA